MVETFTLPNGEVKTLTAYAPAELQAYLQDLTLQLLGVALPPAPPATPWTDAQINAVYAQVRVGWPPQGQPTWGIAEDVCFLTAVTENAPNLLIRSQSTAVAAGQAAGSITITESYGRYWRVRWTFYGPNSSTRAAMVHASLFDDFFYGTLRGLGLAPIANSAIPMRVPELFNAQWWDRTDLTLTLAETVVSTLTTGAVQVVPISGTLDPGAGAPPVTFSLAASSPSEE